MEGLIETLRDLRKKIRTLQNEKSSLLAETEDLRKMADAKASKLESEVTSLRKEIKAFKELLNMRNKTRR